MDRRDGSEIARCRWLCAAHGADHALVRSAVLHGAGLYCRTRHLPSLLGGPAAARAAGGNGTEVRAMLQARLATVLRAGGEGLRGVDPSRYIGLLAALLAEGVGHGSAQHHSLPTDRPGTLRDQVSGIMGRAASLDPRDP